MAARRKSAPAREPERDGLDVAPSAFYRVTLAAPFAVGPRIFSAGAVIQLRGDVLAAAIAESVVATYAVQEPRR